ncbi:MAG: TolB family protein, partial [Blastocatellia bacterium]
MKMNRSLAALALLTLAFVSVSYAGQNDQKRPMTFMDVMEMRAVASPDVSLDGERLLYTISQPDWQAGKRFTDIFMVSTRQGLSSTRQLTSTKDKNQSAPHWSRDGKFFAFLSDRDAPKGSETENQLYVMRPDGGEARKVSDAKGGVESFAFSKDGKWLAFSAGKAEDRQIWAVPVSGVWSEMPVRWTKHSTPIESWQFSPDSQRIFFLSPDAFDRNNVKRKEEKFGVTIRNEPMPAIHLWAFDIESRSEARQTSSPDYSVSNVTISDDSQWIGFRGTPNN